MTQDDPEGYWKFDEPNGTTAIDSSGNGNHGVYQNGPALGQPGIPGNAPLTATQFDGVNDLVRVPDAATLDVGSTFSAEGWIKRSSTAKTHQMMLKGNDGLHLAVMNAGAGSQVYLRKANVTTIARSSVGIPADGQFHHVVATMAGAGTARIYVDGVDVTVPLPGQHIHAIQDTALPLFFSTTTSNAAVFDEFALYDTALSAADVLAHFQAGI